MQIRLVQGPHSCRGIDLGLSWARLAFPWVDLMRKLDADVSVFLQQKNKFENMFVFILIYSCWLFFFFLINSS